MQKRNLQEILQTLIRVNEARINVYCKYVLSTPHPRETHICSCMISESEQYIEELLERLRQITDAEQNANSDSSVALNLWQHMCDTVPGIGSLSLCELQEMILLKSYDEALSQPLDYTTRWLVAGQLRELRISYKLIKCCPAIKQFTVVINNNASVQPKGKRPGARKKSRYNNSGSQIGSKNR